MLALIIVEISNSKHNFSIFSPFLLHDQASSHLVKSVDTGAEGYEQPIKTAEQ